jgi:hypothetical protein
MAASLNLQIFILKGDSFAVILALNQLALTIDWWISSMISDMHLALPASSKWKAKKFNRMTTM